MQSNEEEKVKLLNFFLEINKELLATVDNKEIIKKFSKSALSLKDNLFILNYLNENISFYSEEKLVDEIIESIKDLFISLINPKDMTDSESTLVYEIFINWINGLMYKEMYIKLENHFPLKNVEEIIEICEGKISYKGSLIISAITEFSDLYPDFNLNNKQKLLLIQKYVKYGLSKPTEILIYEKIIPDRLFAKDLNEILY